MTVRGSSLDNQGDPINWTVEALPNGRWFWSIDRPGGQTIRNGLVDTKELALSACKQGSTTS